MARARSSDPFTSHQAADSVEASGQASAQRNDCLKVVRANPGQTAAEIAVATGLERHAPSRRLPELRQGGLVKNGDARICSVTRHMSITWFPAKEVQK